MKNHNPYTIDIIDVTLDVIECLNGEAKSYRAADVAQKLGVNRTRVFRILKTLADRGYIDYDLDTQGYHLGIKFLWVGENIRERLDLRREAEPFLVGLARYSGDSAHLLILHGDTAVTIDRRQGENQLQVATPIGQSVPLYAGASPKILLAYMPEETRERIIQSLKFKQFTKNTITDSNQLRLCLQDIRRKGYAVDEEDYEIGVYAVGAPVRDNSGQVIAGITITTPATRYTSKHSKELIVQVIEAAQKLSERLGYVEETKGTAKTR
jgi:DNA-binding IclR family transcriptional regulator